MTSAAPEKPDLDRVPGIIGGTRVGHVKNLLSRSTFASANLGLTPEVIRRMRRHYQVVSCLTVQSLPIVRADWSIECEDDRVRDGLTEWYRTIAFAVHRSAARSLWAGYSPNGLAWEYLDGLKLIAPAAVRDLDPFTCQPLTDDRGDFDGLVQRLNGDEETIEQLYALWVTEGMESGNYLGRSILEAALDPWQDYAAFRAFHARYLERFGEPIVLCRAPAGKSIGNATEIEQAVANNAGKVEGEPGWEPVPPPVLVDNLDTAMALGQGLRHHSVVALPADLLFGADGKPTGFAWELEFVESKGGKGEDFLDAIRETDQRIARAMFVPDLLLNNTSEVGSNALGQSHRSTWSESVEGRLDDYSRQITEQLLDPVRLLNYGVNSAPARLIFKPLADEAVDRWWELVKILAEGGALPVDVDEVAQGLGIPLLDAADRPAVPAAPDDASLAASVERFEAALTAALAKGGPVAPPPAADAAHAAHEPERWLDTLALDPVAGLPEWRIPQDYDPPAFRRALNDREERVGFQRIEAGLNASEAATIAQLDELLAAEHDRILRQLAGILKRGSVAEILKALGELELGVGPKVTRAWSDLMATVAAETLAGLRGELAAYANDLPESLGTEGRALFASYATTSADSALSKLLTEVRANLLNGFTSGVSRAGLAAIVGQVFDAYSTSEAKPVRLTTRMLTSKSMNYTRAAAVERGGIPLAGAQYSAVLDRRTCDLCASMDEQIIPIEHSDLARFTPPVHHNCRCLWVWITRDEADFTPTWKTPAASLVDRFGGLVF